jgi:hypothetical protein
MHDREINLNTKAKIIFSFVAISFICLVAFVCSAALVVPLIFFYFTSVSAEAPINLFVIFSLLLMIITSISESFRITYLKIKFGRVEIVISLFSMLLSSISMTFSFGEKLKALSSVFDSTNVFLLIGYFIMFFLLNVFLFGYTFVFGAASGFVLRKIWVEK